MQHAIAEPHRRAATLALAIVVFLVTFGDVLVQELHGTAAFYAALAREMLDRGDPLAPFHGAQAYLLKPPLAFWSSALTSAVLGINDFAMTLPSRLAGLGCVALTWVLARRLYGPTAGWFAALVLATNGIYIQFTTNFRMDSLMTFGALLTLWGYFNPQRARGAAAFFGGIAVSALTKGPMIFAMLLVFLPHAWATGWRHRIGRGFLAWAVLLLPPAAWYAYLYLVHGSELAAQLNYDFWRGDTAIGLSARDSALLEYLFKPLRRLWPWLPFMVLAVVYAGMTCLARRTTRLPRADLALLLGLFLLNYGIAVVKPDPDVRYLYPSLPLVAIFCGGLFSRWTGGRLPRAVAWSAHALAVLAIALAVQVSLRGLEDARGLERLRALAASGRITSANSTVIVDTLRPPGAPRRNDPMPDSVYYYFGLTPAVILMPATAAALPEDARFVFVRRKRIHEQALTDLGLVPLGRSAKIALFARR
ncbi:MAG: ArnT family glycosyltransferase [Gammaproteobacteria bacterium]